MLLPLTVIHTFLKVGFNPSPILDCFVEAKVPLPTGNTQDFDAFSHTIVWHLNLLDGDSVNIPLCDNLDAMEWLKLFLPISIHQCHAKKKTALMQWSINW